MARRLAAVATVLVMVCTLGSAAIKPAAAAGRAATVQTTATVPATMTVNPRGRSRPFDSFVPVAGSAQAAVFVRYDSAGVFQGDTIGALTAVDAAGRQVRLGTASSFETFSMSGPMLTTVDQRHPGQVSWWNVSSHAKGLAAIPAGATYLGASRSGYLYEHSDGAIAEISEPAGMVTELGSPFAAESAQIAALTTVSGPHGVVAVGKTKAVYLPFARPGGATTLRRPTAHKLPHSGSDRSLVCTFADATSAGCFTTYLAEDNDGGFETLRLNAYVDPLNGSRPTTVLPIPFDRSCDRQVTLLRSSLAYIAGCARRVHIARHGAKTTTYPGHYSSLIPALSGLMANSGAVAPGPGSAEPDRRLLLLSRPGRPGKVIGAPRHSISEATAFSLAAGNVAWTDDAGGPRRLASVVRERSVDASADHVVLGATPRADTGRVATVGVISASGDTVAYALEARSGVTMLVHSPRGTQTVATDVGDATTSFSLSGHQLVYGRLVGTHLELYDVGSGTRRAIGPTVTAGVPAIQDYVLDGENLVYSTTDGAVHRENVGSGVTTTVMPAGTGAREVFELGDQVGWNVGYPEGPVTGALRNATTMGPITTLPAGRAILSLSSNGVVSIDSTALVTNGEVPPPFLANQPTSPGYAEQIDAIAHWRVFLSGFTASAGTPLLSGDYLRDVPQVADDVLAWIDATGRLQARALPHVADRPRSLGDPIAPPTFADGQSAPWQADLAYSAPLTSCQVQIVKNSNVIRTLACDPADAAVGNAVVTWNGRDSNGVLVPTGDVTWRAVVSNADGSAVGAAVTGTIAINPPA